MDLFSMYLQDYRLRSRSVVGRYDATYARGMLLRRVQRAIGKPLLMATTTDYAHWYTDLTGRVGPDGCISELRGTRAFYQWAIRNGHTATDPTRLLIAPAATFRRPHPIGEDDLRAALRAAEPARVLPTLILAAYAGLRAHEIASLHTDHIEGDCLVIVGKGSRERVVDIHPAVELVLATLPLGWMFPYRDGRPGHIGAWLVSQSANRHLHACGIDSTLHKLRHRFASLAYQSSHDLLMVQGLLGHSSPKTTAMYASFDRSQTRTVVCGLPWTA